METKKVHFMGLGGAGISAVANFAKAAGFEISGCDIDSSSPFLKNLLEEKVPFVSEHKTAHIENIDYLVVSPAIESLDPHNPEVLAARQNNIPVLIGEEFLAKYLIGDKKVIAVSGTHGKSTTTAMIGKILEDSGLDPLVLVGALVTDWGKNFRLGNGKYFVIEADEYQKKFLLYQPYITVITAIEMDHPEYFKDLTEVENAFKDFIAKTKEDGKIIFGKNIPFENSQALILGKDFQIENYSLKLLGDFNLENAALAAETVRNLNVDEKTIKASLENFLGIARRFEFKGEARGVKVYDDYGHHPTAIKATVEAARKKFPNQKIWLVYQPHMFSRTKKLFEEFVSVFKNLGIEGVVLVDIYAARQKNMENISSADIISKVNLPNVSYIGDFEKAVGFMTEKLTSKSLVIVMGAGDIYKLSGMLLEKLNAKNR